MGAADSVVVSLRFKPDQNQEDSPLKTLIPE